jgi:uncharacterized RDD family membrane protein YckC
MEEVSGAAAPRVSLGGFWRRLGAFAVDWMILALGGGVVGQLLFDQLAWLGGWDRLLGFVIATLYFGLLDSGPFGASTPGKRAFGLRVVDAAGRVVSLPKSMLRAGVLVAPIMFNGTIVVMSDASYGERAASGLMGGLAIASIYMLAFNRSTRQGLHDLASGAFVVRGRASRQAMSGLALWRAHLAVAAIFVVTGVPISMAGYPVYVGFAPGTSSKATLLPSLGPPLVRAAWIRWTPVEGTPRTCTSVTVSLRGTGVDDEDIARKVAQGLVLRFHCHVDTNLAVRMVYGFDLGFAGGHRYRDYVIDADQFPGQP